MNNGNEGKRLDKLLKRAKPLWDEKLKSKQRLKGLQSFLEISNENDEITFFSQHAQVIYEIAFESYVYRVNRMKERNASKDVVHLFEIIDIFSIIIKLLHQKIAQGWNYQSLCGIIESLLASGNSSRLRKAGLNLLTSFIIHENIEDENILYLTSLILPIEDFEFHSLSELKGANLHEIVHDQLKIYFEESKNQHAPGDKKRAFIIDSSFSGCLTSILPRESTIGKIESYIDIFKDFCDHLLNSSSSMNTIKYFWGLLEQKYLRPLFPSVKSVKMPPESKKAVCICPIEILEVLSSFITKALTENEHGVRALLLDEENLDYVHETLKQCCIWGLPKYAINIFMFWYTTPESDNSPYLCSCLPKESLEHIPNVNCNIILQKYLKFTRTAIIRKVKEQKLYSQITSSILMFYQFAAIEKYHTLDSATWELLLTLTLDLHFQLTIEQPLQLENQELQESFAYTLNETLLKIFIRSRVESDWLWKRLQSQLKNTISAGLINVWTNLNQELSLIMVMNLYGISQIQLSGDPLKRKRIKLKGDSLSNNKLNLPDEEHSSIIASQRVRELLNEKENSDSKLSNIIWKEISNFNSIKEAYIWKDAHYSLFTWKNIITCIGKLEDIQDSKLHFEAIKSIANVADILLKVNNIQTFGAAKLPSLFDLTGILFKASFMKQEYRRSIAVANGCICRIMLRKHNQESFLHWQPVFFKLMIKYLSLPPVEESRAIWINCSKLFTAPLPASTLTIPAVISYCRLLYNSSIEDYENMHRTALCLLGGLIPFEGNYDHLINYPILNSGSYPIEDSDNQVSSSPGQLVGNLKFAIAEIFQTYLNEYLKKKNYELCELLLWHLSILLYHEIVSNKQNLRTEILQVILDQLIVSNYQVSSTAINCISLIANECRAFDHETQLHIIDRLVWGISEKLSKEDKSKLSHESISALSIISNLLKCLIETLMKLPTKIVANSNTSLRISEVIDEICHFADGGIELNIHDSDLCRILKSFKETANFALLHLSLHLDNYAPIKGAASINSAFVESFLDEDLESENIHYLSFSDSSIITFINIPAESKTQVLIRNSAGKYAWEMRQFYHSLDEVENQHDCCKISVKMNESGISEYETIVEEPLASDPLEKILERYIYRFIYSRLPSECMVSTSLGVYDNQFHEILAHTSEQYDEDNALEAAPPNRSTLSAKSLEVTRLLLFQMGQMCFEHLKKSQISFLAKSQSLWRDIRGLDKKYSREVAKFALLYVAQGQEDEFSILNNTCGSYEYDEFVLSLGWEIGLDDHLGYFGGLEGFKEGKAIYYCSSTVEMIFHDICRLPSSKSDMKQLKRKRHIGNDQVHIIWNEHSKDYKFETIGGDFGNVQIVINPMKNGLFSIDVYKDEELGTFGPLQNKSIVSKACLGPLVRATAMNAYRNCLNTELARTETHPFSQRAKTIQMITARHKANPSTFEGFFSLFL